MCIFESYGKNYSFYKGAVLEIMFILRHLPHNLDYLFFFLSYKDNKIRGEIRACNYLVVKNSYLIKDYCLF